MKKLVAILAFFCLATMSFAANVIVVTHNGTPTTYSDISAAFAGQTNGDTIDIQSFDGPLAMTTGAGLQSWSTLKCTAGSPATILANGYIGALDHTTLTNIIFDGQGTVANFFNGGTASTVTNCTFKNTTWASIFYANGGDAAGVTFTNCYFINNGHTSIGFTNNWNSAGMTNKAIIDHCTFVDLGGSSVIGLDDKYAGKDLKQVFSLRNSIITNRTGATGIIYAAGELLDAATQVDEDYNIFDAWWHPLYSEGNDTANNLPASDHAGAHSVKVDGRSAEFYRDFAAGDFRLMATATVAVGAGEGGSNIGADLLTGSNVFTVKNGATVKATVGSLTAALAAAVTGDTIDITDYVSPINGAGGFQLKGVNLVCSAATQAVINFPGAKDASIYADLTYMLAVHPVTISNIKFVGTGIGYGLIAFDKLTINNCSFSKFADAGVWLLGVDDGFAPAGGANSGALDATITNTYITDCGTGIQVSNVDAFSAAPTLASKINLDHCTVSVSGYPFSFDTTYMDGEPSHDLSPLTMTNTLLSSTGNLSAIFVQDTGTHKGNVPANWTEHHNAFLTSATKLINWQITDPGVQPTANKYDVVSATAPVFTNAAAGDYTLKAGDAANFHLSKRGVGAKNIGADIATNVPVELSAFSAE